MKEVKMIGPKIFLFFIFIFGIYFDSHFEIFEVFFSNFETLIRMWNHF